MLPAQPNKSIINGTRCLQAVVSHADPVGVRELARELGLEPTKVNRILKTYAHMGLIRQIDDNRYQPGPGIHVLAAQSLHGSGLLKAALPSIRELLETGHSVALGVLWQEKVCYLYHGQPDRPVEEGIGGTQNLYPAHYSSIGLSIIAGTPDHRKPPPAPAGYTISSIKDIKKSGFAAVRQPDGTVSLGSGIGSPPAAGLALAGPISERQIPFLVEKLKKATAAIQGTLDNN